MVNKKLFPIFWTIILLFAIAWLLDELEYLALEIPWFPVILGIIAIGAIVNRLWLG